MKEIKIASLFCGCGGTDVGFRGGFEFLGKHYAVHKTKLVYANDIESSACEIFRKNFGINPDQKDIKLVKSEEIPSCNVVLGGFPCQSFSVVAQNPPRLGIKSPLGQLFFEMCRIVKEKQPEVFMAENVKGILSSNKGETFPLILKEFGSCGYSVNWKLLKAVDFGIPQKRERVIIIGVRNDLHKTFNFDELPVRKPDEYAILRNVVQESVPENYFFSDKAVAGMVRVRGVMNKGRAQDLDKPCNTVGAHLAKVSLNSTDPVLFDGGRFRRFTPREVARIQSFPDSYELFGSEHAQYKALGNAVAPLMAWYLSEEIYSQILKDKK